MLIRNRERNVMLLFGSLLSIYVFCRAVLPLRLHWGWKAGLGAALLATAFKFHLLYLFGRTDVFWRRNCRSRC